MATFTTIKSEHPEKIRPSLIERLQDLALELRAHGTTNPERTEQANDIEDLIGRYEHLRIKRHNQRKANRGVNKAYEAMLHKYHAVFEHMLDAKAVVQQLNRELETIKAVLDVVHRGDTETGKLAVEAYYELYMSSPGDASGPSSSVEPESSPEQT